MVGVDRWHACACIPAGQVNYGARECIFFGAFLIQAPSGGLFGIFTVILGRQSATLWVHVFALGSMDLVLDDNRVHHPLRAR